jgi:ABC-type multidrug transport system fused ATPase/permease subunit
VLVLDHGRVAEFDTPQNLLSSPSSMFSALVADWEKSND